MPAAPAIEKWRDVLGTENVLCEPAQVAEFEASTMGSNRRISAVLKPTSISQIQHLTRIAAAEGVPLYPISTGNNWGYGSALPIMDDCAVVDLSGLRGIRVVDQTTGVIEVEPGVTQRQLRDFLDANDMPFMVPVTGAGPDCSILGNALERGYGITPYADHFGATTAIEAVLPDGSIYHPALSELGADRLDGAFKWGFGPYLDGMFTQGAFGIITKMTLALAPAPERVEGFFFGVRSETDLGPAITCVRRALQRVGAVSGSINLMNQRRVLAMITAYPKHQIGDDGLIRDTHLAELAKANQVMAWTGAGALYGSRRIVAAARREIRNALRPIAKRLVFFAPRTPQRLVQIARWVPGAFGHQMAGVFDTLDKSLQLLAGTPSEIALPLAYWRSGRLPSQGQRMNPARDGCGLIWYSPLIPMEPEDGRYYVQMVEEICRSHRIEPLITLTSLSDRCWDSTVPILFDRNSPEETDRARACYDALLTAGMEQGFVPYRTNIDSMDKFIRPDAPFWSLVEKIKKAVDPDGIMSPGRYAPTIKR